MITTPQARPWLSGEPGEWLLTLKIQPGARTSEAVGEHGGALKIRIAAPPVEGKANEALLRWLSLRLEVPIRSLSLASGASSRTKRVKVAFVLSADDLLERLALPPE